MDDPQQPNADNIVTEGELVDTTTEANNLYTVSETLDLTGLINSQIKQIENVKQQIFKLKEMLDGIFENDETYQQHDAAVKEATKVRGNTKKQIQKLPPVQDLQNRIQTLKSEAKEVGKSLSENLQDYARNTGSTTFETDDGEVREIVYTARLVKKNDFRP